MGSAWSDRGGKGDKNKKEKKSNDFDIFNWKEFRNGTFFVYIQKLCYAEEKNTTTGKEICIEFIEVRHHLHANPELVIKNLKPPAERQQN